MKQVSEIESELRDKFREKALEPDTLFLLNAKDTSDLIAEGAARGLLLAGVEGFRITDRGAYQPLQRWSCDIVDTDGDQSEFQQTTLKMLGVAAEYGIRFDVAFANS